MRFRNIICSSSLLPCWVAFFSSLPQSSKKVVVSFAVHSNALSSLTIPDSSRSLCIELFLCPRPIFIKSIPLSLFLALASREFIGWSAALFKLPYPSPYPYD